MAKKLLLLPVLLAVTTAACTARGADARLGQSIEGFKAKLRPSYKLKTVNKKEDRSYFVFTMISDAKTQETSPGFGAGITATVVDGKVVGQSMVLRLGDNNYTDGKDLATLHSMDFAYEALGKPAPKSQAATKQEFDQFASAIDQVLGGNAQHVKYPGYNQLITMSRTEGGDILIAVTPAFASKVDKPVKPKTAKPTSGPGASPLPQQSEPGQGMQP